MLNANIVTSSRRKTDFKLGQMEIAKYFQTYLCSWRTTSSKTPNPNPSLSAEVFIRNPEQRGFGWCCRSTTQICLKILSEFCLLRFEIGFPSTRSHYQFPSKGDAGGLKHGKVV